MTKPLDLDAAAPRGGELPTTCDLETSPGRFCGEQVSWFALSATTPDMWGAGPRASLAGFCCREHADQEPRATREQAATTFTEVIGMRGDDACVAVWRELLARYPDPIQSAP